jgi:hypothetical protein
MPGASPQTRRVTVLDANWSLGEGTDGDRFGADRHRRPGAFPAGGAASMTVFGRIGAGEHHGHLGSDQPPRIAPLARREYGAVCPEVPPGTEAGALPPRSVAECCSCGGVSCGLASFCRTRPDLGLVNARSCHGR